MSMRFSRIRPARRPVAAAIEVRRTKLLALTEERLQEMLAKDIEGTILDVEYTRFGDSGFAAIVRHVQ